MVEKETASPLWNQLFYFDTVEVATDELEACNVVVRVCDKLENLRGTWSSGASTSHLAAVYLSQGHEYWNEWFTLTDFSGRRSGSQGELCMCVTVLHEGSTRPALHLR